jgi:hypothetical protein
MELATRLEGVVAVNTVRETASETEDDVADGTVEELGGGLSDATTVGASLGGAVHTAGADQGGCAVAVLQGASTKSVADLLDARHGSIRSQSARSSNAVPAVEQPPSAVQSVAKVRGPRHGAAYRAKKREEHAARVRQAQEDAKQALLAELQTRTFETEQEARCFYGALRLSIEYEPLGWRCHAFQTLHRDGPQGCAAPSQGGEWVGRIAAIVTTENGQP